MTAAKLERFTTIRQDVLERTRQGLSLVAIRSNVVPFVEVSQETESELPKELQNVFDKIKDLPAEEIDLRLAELVYAAQQYEQDTAEIPAILVDEIHETANQLVDEWNDDKHTLFSATALTNAYSITHDEKLIDTAKEIANDAKHMSNHPLVDLAEVVHKAAETGTDFTETMKRTRNAQSIASKAIPRSPLPTGDFNKDTPIELYEDLFHPEKRRPNSPAYTHAGIHPNLNKDGSLKQEAS